MSAISCFVELESLPKSASKRVRGIMCKIRLILLITLTSIMMSLFITNISASEEIILLTKSINKVYLGMEYSEFKKLYPESHNVSGKPEDRMAVVDFIKDDLWDSVMYDFQDRHLASFSLLRGVLKREGMKESIQLVVSKAIDEYGKDFSKKVVKGTGKKEMHSLFIWVKKEFTVYLSYTPDDQIAKGKRPGIRLTYAIPDRKLSELFEIPTSKEIEERLFESIVGEEIQKKLN